MKEKFRKILNIIFLVTLTIIYLLMIYIDFIKGKDSTTLKFIGIILCFIYSLSNISKDKNSIFISIGLLFTTISDYFLLVRGDHYSLGVGTFIVTQLAYFLFITPRDKFRLSLIIRTSLIFIGLIVLMIIKNKDLTVFLTMIYFINLVLNFLSSIIFKFRGHIMLSIGLFLFICCDVSVGLSQLDSYFNISGDLYNLISKICGTVIWVFYLPSQILISNESYIRRKEYEK